MKIKHYLQKIGSAVCGLAALGYLGVAQAEILEPPAADVPTQKVRIVKYLLKKIQWPKEVISDNTLNFCILGKDDTVGKLNALNGSILGPYKITVIKLTSYLSNNNRCQLIYVCASEKEKSLDIIQAYKNQPVALLADIPNFAEKGGTMNFAQVKNQVALTINTENLANAHLKLEMGEFDEITVVPDLKDILRK